MSTKSERIYDISISEGGLISRIYRELFQRRRKYLGIFQRYLLSLSNKGMKIKINFIFIYPQSKWQRSTEHLTTAREGVRRRGLSFTVGGVANWYSHCGNMCREPSKCYKIYSDSSPWHSPKVLPILAHRYLLSHIHYFSISNNSREWKWPNFLPVHEQI